MSGSVLPTFLLYHFTQQLARCRTWPWWGWLPWPLNVIALFLACSHDEFHGFFTTAAAFSALGGTWPWPWVRTAASSVTRKREGESSLSSLSRSLSLRLLRSWRSGVVTLTLSANSGVERDRELNGESCLSSLSRSLSSRLLRSRCSG